jgi:hypothetical protein
LRAGCWQHQQRLHEAHGLIVEHDAEVDGALGQRWQRHPEKDDSRASSGREKLTSASAELRGECADAAGSGTLGR